MAYDVFISLFLLSEYKDTTFFRHTQIFLNKKMGIGLKFPIPMYMLMPINKKILIIYLVGSLGMIALSFKWLDNIKIKLKTSKNYSSGDALAILFLLYCSTKIQIIFETCKSF